MRDRDTQGDLAKALSGDHDARLVVLEAAPVHSLWIGKQLSLLATEKVEVILLSVIRDLFAAHPDCRKGAEVTDFLQEHSPPIRYASTDLWTNDAPNQGSAPTLRDLTLAVSDFMSAATGYQQMRQDDRKSFLLVGDKMQWFMLNSGSEDVFIDTRDFLLAAEAACLMQNAGEILQQVNLPGEILDWR